MEVLFRNVRELVERANQENKLISEIMIEQEIMITGSFKRRNNGSNGS